MLLIIEIIEAPTVARPQLRGASNTAWARDCIVEQAPGALLEAAPRPSSADVIGDSGNNTSDPY